MQRSINIEHDVCAFLSASLNTYLPPCLIAALHLNFKVNVCKTYREDDKGKGQREKRIYLLFDLHKMLCAYHTIKTILMVIRSFNDDSNCFFMC